MVKAPNNNGLNIIPFIDIMLVLLAMILSISTFIAHGEIKLELPQSNSSTQASNDDDKIQITIDAENIFHINNLKADIHTIKEKLNAIHPKTIVELKSDKNAKFDSFIQIIDILRNNNHQNFQIITKKQP